MKTKSFFLIVCLFVFLSSCFTPVPEPTIVTPIETEEYYSVPYFSFEDIDPNNMDSSYRERMKKYDIIMGECPIPIYVITQKQFLLDYVMKIDFIMSKRHPDTEFYGLYSFDVKVKGFPNEFIFINIDMAPEQILTTYFHEYGHYLHRKKNCVCFQINDIILKEKHALQNEFEMAWKYNLPEVMESSFRTMALFMLDDRMSMTYKIAIAELMKEKIWRKTLDYLIKIEAEREKLKKIR